MKYLYHRKARSDGKTLCPVFAMNEEEAIIIYDIVKHYSKSIPNSNMTDNALNRLRSLRSGFREYFDKKIPTNTEKNYINNIPKSHL